MSYSSCPVQWSMAFNIYGIQFTSTFDFSRSHFRFKNSVHLSKYSIYMLILTFFFPVLCRKDSFSDHLVMLIIQFTFSLASHNHYADELIQFTVFANHFDMILFM